MRISFLSFVLLFISLPSMLCAQSVVEVAKTLNYKQPATPIGADSYLFSTFFYNARKAYNMKGFVITSATYPILNLKFNPAGNNYALLSRNEKRAAVDIYDAWATDKRLFKVEAQKPTAICYSADSRRFFVAVEGGTLFAYETRDYHLLSDIKLPQASTVSQLVASGNDYFIAAASGSKVYVCNQESNTVRETITLSERVTDIAFSPESDLLAVLTADGAMHVYETRSFQPTSEYRGLGQAISMSFHPEGKYVGVLISQNDMVFINLIDSSDRPVLHDDDGGLHFLRFVQDGKQQSYLVYNTEKMLRVKLLKGFTPNLSRLMMDELNLRMEEWAKMRPNETLDEYQLRVNEETRRAQARLYEQEIATELASSMDMQLDVKLGSYNAETNILTLGFEKMPQIYLNVPEEELSSFHNTSELEFRDVIYTMSKDEKFEIIYAQVYNKQTGKNYEFNNLERRSLDYLLADDDFVPIELVQLSGMEEVKLQAIKDDVVTTAMQNDLISDHTKIKVSSNVVQDVDASGKRITNYKVNFNYTVEGNYSVKDDFAPGRYKIEDSHAAISMLGIVSRAFGQDFAQYIKPDKKLIVKLTGSADALRIGGAIAYDGCYGDFTDEPYRLNGTLNSITVTQQTGISTNEQLAFMRAVGVKDYISKHVPTLQTMNTDYQYQIELTEKTGSQYRRINVEFIFVDAFSNQ